MIIASSSGLGRSVAMLEKIPHWLGSALGNVRAGHDKLTLARLDLDGAASLDLSSPAFAAGDRLPPRFTADGDGVSPPLVWRNVPDGTGSLALIVEDPDAPTPRPMVHGVVIDIDPSLGGLPEGALRPDGDGAQGKDVGKNSRLAEGWLPPDPPTGHGSHDYVFQLLALGEGGAHVGHSPGRGDFIDHVRGRVGRRRPGRHLLTRGGSGSRAGFQRGDGKRLTDCIIGAAKVNLL